MTQMFYNGYQTITHNAVFNMIIGPRGYGKSFWAKEWAIKDFIKRGNQFMYVRRYNSDLKEIFKFFDDIITEGIFPDDDLEVKGDSFYINGELAGYAVALSKAQSLKSTPFPLVDKIIFDEFILEKGAIHYIQGDNEPEVFIGLCETVFRSRDNVKAFLLANSVTMNNPYFKFWDISFPGDTKLVKRNNGLVLAQLVDGKEFKDYKKKTRMARAIEGTRYAAYSIDNDFYLDSDTFIEKKKGTANFYMKIIFKGKTYGIWQDFKEGTMTVSMDVDPYCKREYALTLDDHTPNTLLISALGKSPAIKRFIDMYRLGVVRFESMSIKSATYEMIKMLT